MANPDNTEWQDITADIGPKRTETKEVQIEAHDPLKIQKLLERRKAKPILFSDFPVTRVVPKCTNKVCNEDQNCC
jgi:hypothetical protein